MSTETRERGRMWRSRWAAVGAAMAVVAGVGGVGAAFASGSAPATVSIAPCRLVDTRPGGGNVGPRSTPLGQGQSFDVRALGKTTNCQIPVAATALLMNVTVVNGTANSYLTAWPQGSSRPTASNLNWRAGDGATPNFVNSAIGSGGGISFYNFAGTVDVVVDVTGYTVGSSPERLTGQQLAERRWDLDPSTPANISVGTGPYRTAFDGANVWVSNLGSNTVSKINPATNQVVASVGINSPRGLAFDGSFIWVTSFGTNRVYKVDPVTYATTSVVVGTSPTDVLFDGSWIWVANINADTVTRVDPATGTAGLTVSVGSGPKGLAFDGTSLYVANSYGNTVSRIDPSSGAVLNTLVVGSGPQSLAFDGQFLWSANFSSGSVSRINPGDLTVVRGAVLVTNPEGIAFDGRNVWVTERTPYRLARIDRDSLSVTTTIAMPAAPLGLTWDGTNLWAADYGANLVSKLKLP